MRKNIHFLLLACMIFVLMAACAGAGGHEKASTSKSAGQHPELTEQEKLTPCSSCHREITPDVYEQWYNSRHGLDKVKCFQCHGTYEDLKVCPDETRCAACHNAQFRHSVEGKTCWACHPAHGFTVHR